MADAEERHGRPLDPNERAICMRIQTARAEAGYTQAELARMLGMTTRSYQRLEGEKAIRVPYRWLPQIAEFTRRSPIYLMYGIDPAYVTPNLSNRLEALTSDAEQTATTLAHIAETLSRLERKIEGVEEAMMSSFRAAIPDGHRDGGRQDGFAGSAAGAETAA